MDNNRNDNSYTDDGYTDINDFSETRAVFFDDETKKIDEFDNSIFTPTDTLSDFSEMASFSDREQYRQNTASVQHSVKKSSNRVKKEAKIRNSRKRRKNRMVFRIVWLSLILIVGVFFGLILSRGAKDVFAMERQKKPFVVEIQIPEQASVKEVSDILTKANVISEPSFFSLYCKVTGVHTFVRGEFNMPTNMDYEEIIDFLFSTTNRTDVIEIMFYEGINIFEVAQLLEENDVATASEVLSIANSTSFDKYDIISQIPDITGKYYKIEGYLFPDTYKFYKGEGAENALSRLIYNGQKKIITDDVEERLAEIEMTYDDIIIIASLIQAEAANIGEMDEIASVIYNRLENGHLYDIWTLGLDSTIFYPYRTKEDVPASLGNYSSDYNTYVINGLPKGAICNPGMSAIEAALNPSDTDYYYFLHGKDGKTYFARTAAEHEQNLYTSGLYE